MRFGFLLLAESIDFIFQLRTSVNIIHKGVHRFHGALACVKAFHRDQQIGVIGEERNNSVQDCVSFRLGRLSFDFGNGFLQRKQFALLVDEFER